MPGARFSGQAPAHRTSTHPWGNFRSAPVVSDHFWTFLYVDKYVRVGVPLGVFISSPPVIRSGVAFGA